MRVQATVFLLFICLQALQAQDDPLKEVYDAEEALGRATTAERFQRTIDLGKAYRDADQLDSARAVCTRALSIAASDKERMVAQYQLARTLRDLPDHALAQQHAREAILLARALGDTMTWIRSEDLLVKIALAMQRADVAHEHTATQLRLAEATRDPAALISLYNDLGNAHYLAGRYDSTLWYYTKCIALMQANNPQRVAMRMNMANLYIEEQRFGPALALLDTVRNELPAAALSKRSQYHNIRGYALFSMQRYREAIAEFKQSDSLNRTGANVLTLAIENTGFMAESHAALGDSGKAYRLMADLEVMKDSLNGLASDEQMLALEKKFETRLNKEEIQRLDTENRQKEERLRLRNVQLYGSLALALLALAGVVLIWRNLRQRRKHATVLEELNGALEDKQARIEEINALLRMRVLRTQMDPHFIHNCLNAIRALSLKGHHERADEYLEGFARLLRTVLEHSVRDRITLEEEIAFLQDYVKLEQLRLGDDFTWSITADQALIDEEPLIPSLMVQPFVENAIWHGLAPRSGPKRLEVVFEERDGAITCTVQDNGIGRTQKAPVTGRRSLGLQLTGERLQLLTERLGNEGAFHVIDLKDEQEAPAGTRVSLKL